MVSFMIEDTLKFSTKKKPASVSRVRDAVLPRTNHNRVVIIMFCYVYWVEEDRASYLDQLHVINMIAQAIVLSKKGPRW